MFLCFALSAMLFAPFFSAEAQQPARIFRIGFLDANTAAGTVLVPAYREELSKL